MAGSASSRRPFAPFALLGFALALAALAAAAGAGLGAQAGLWDFRTGFTILRWAAWGGLAALAVSLVGCFTAPSGGPRRGLALAAIGAVVGTLVFAWPAAYQNAARAVPRVWDITTDMTNPPAFVAILPLRAEAKATNPPDYRGGAFSEIQRKAYPDIQPVRTARPPAEAFAGALRAAEASGWEIIASVPAEGRIEAVAATRWFGFKDDVVIRVAADGAGSRIDIRSYSRLGRNDAGKNAQRVRAWLARLNGELGGA